MRLFNEKQPFPYIKTIFSKMQLLKKSSILFSPTSIACGLIIRRQSKNFCKNMLMESTLVKKEKYVIHFPSLFSRFSLI